MAKKYISKINQGGVDIYVKDSEAIKSVFTSSAIGAAPSTAAGNITTAETSSTVNYLCSDGKWRPLPAGAWKTGTSTSDTKNTAGSTNKAATLMYLIGAISQAANPVTYSNVNCYIGTDNQLYSNGSAVLTGTYASSAEAITAANELT